MASAFSATANGRVLNPPPTGGPVQSAVPSVDAFIRNFTVTHKRLTVDGSRVLQTDRGVGSKVGGWGEKNLKGGPVVYTPHPKVHTVLPLALMITVQSVCFVCPSREAAPSTG